MRMANVLVLTPGKEYIINRKANKTHLCHECHKPIEKGEYYIEDHINYLQKSRFDVVWKKHYTNRICFGCWRGPLPWLGWPRKLERLSPTPETSGKLYSALHSGSRRKWLWERSVSLRCTRNHPTFFVTSKLAPIYKCLLRWTDVVVCGVLMGRTKLYDRKVNISLPGDLADWLDEMVKADRFSSVAHGIRRCIRIAKDDPEVTKKLWTESSNSALGKVWQHGHRRRRKSGQRDT